MSTQIELYLERSIFAAKFITKVSQVKIHKRDLT